jgi:L-ascorbate metabolism protein UlaG (beta-lactamase superfamily)
MEKLETDKIKIQRLGHATFRFESPARKIVVVDPWISGNPTCPIEFRNAQKWSDVDLILLTHGHFDHTAGLDEILSVNGKAIIVANYELALVLMSQGKSNVWPINTGGSLTVDGIRVSAVNAAHSSSDPDPNTGITHYLGAAMGYVVEFENGKKVYIAGDTGLTADMKFVVGDFYKPEVAILPVDGVLTMSPELAAFAASAISPAYVIPCHDFPEISEAHDPEGLKAALEQAPFIHGMKGKSLVFAECMKDHPTIKTVVLWYGESFEF